ncbi:GNAT family N-acetyltransferase [Streptococcus loxodontisalivarius]|uniref:Ribosomal protein S18 acetylase RimI-like enzyme n=1 Tax=Streptococcus loxodontisalivarius TaxID=1349415 RepID=A0ABS2PQ10_9STRE|nr:GNAT family N-acetyltransferase [Streptococcus loxodontisalivarius]MBM7641785.1 ribosomal protein S18 acetylase RimI-like enzyme [Streptococcus loxodontisalivarius]
MIFAENDRFRYIKNEKLNLRYYENYLSYKIQPDLATFQSDLKYLVEQQSNYPDPFAFFFFAENAELTGDLKDYLTGAGFDLSKHLIFTNQLKNLNLKEKDISPVRIELLDESYLADFVQLEYEAQLAYGQDYANQMKVYHENDLLADPSKIYLALDGQKIVGAVTAWHFGDYIEIDDYHVDEAYQGRGIGTALQSAASRGYEKVILLSEELNREMYEHQGYEEVGYYWTALKA